MGEDVSVCGTCGVLVVDVVCCAERGPRSAGPLSPTRPPWDSRQSSGRILCGLRVSTPRPRSGRMSTTSGLRSAIRQGYPSATDVHHLRSAGITGMQCQQQNVSGRAIHADQCPDQQWE